MSSRAHCEIVAAACLLFTLSGCDKVQPKNSDLRDNSADSAVARPQFAFRKLKVGTSLDEAKRSQTVDSCLDQTNDVVGCVFTSLQLGTVGVRKSYVWFRNRAFDSMSLEFMAENFDTVKSEVESVYGRPCKVSSEALQNAFGAKFDGDTLSWCFNDGTLYLRRHLEDDLRAGELAFEGIREPIIKQKFTKETL